MKNFDTWGNFSCLCQKKTLIFVKSCIVYQQCTVLDDYFETSQVNKPAKLVILSLMNPDYKPLRYPYMN